MYLKTFEITEDDFNKLSETDLNKVLITLDCGYEYNESNRQKLMKIIKNIKHV